MDRSADLRSAARYIVASKAFDHSVICATEQAVVADRPIAAQLAELMQAEGAYFVDAEQAKALAGLLFSSGQLINPKAVGKSPQQLAQMCGITRAGHRPHPGGAALQGRSRGAAVGGKTYYRAGLVRVRWLGGRL